MKTKLNRINKKILSKTLSGHLSSGIAYISSTDIADLFPDAYLSASEVNQFILAAEAISDETKQAALDLLHNPRRLAAANLLMKSIVASAEHPLERKYIEQTFAVNRFPIWFLGNIGSLSIAGNECAPRQTLFSLLIQRSHRCSNHRGNLTLYRGFIVRDSSGRGDKYDC